MAAPSRAPHKCRGSSASRPTPKRSAARTKVGDAQERPAPRRAEPETGRGRVGRPRRRRRSRCAMPKPPLPAEALLAPPPPAADATPAAAKREVRWTTLLPSPDGRRAGRVGARRRQHRPLAGRVSTRPPAARRCSITCTTTRGSGTSARTAATAAASAGCPTTAALWFLAEHDGWMHLYTVDAAAETPARVAAHLGPLRDRCRASCRPTAGTFHMQSTEPHPGERHLYVVSVDGGARTRAHHGDRRPRTARLARQRDARPDLVVVEPAARGLRDAEPRRRAGGAA